MYKKLFDKKLVSLEENVISRNELFEAVATKLFNEGYVEKTYFDALKKREDEFPTGLETQFLSIALPHTDPEHIKKPFVFIVKNTNNLDFLQMGDNKELSVKNFLFLGIKEPNKQVGLLARLMELFMNDSFVKEFNDITDGSSMYELLVENI